MIAAGNSIITGQYPHSSNTCSSPAIEFTSMYLRAMPTGGGVLSSFETPSDEIELGSIECRLPISGLYDKTGLPGE